MHCRDVEEVVAVGVTTFQLLGRIEDSWRDRVFRGTEEYRPEDDATIRDSNRGWLETTEAILAEVPALEQRFGAVEGMAELRSCADHARKLLVTWEPPRLSRAIGFREMTLTSEAAAELDRIVREVKEKPPGHADPEDGDARRFLPEVAFLKIRFRRYNPFPDRLERDFLFPSALMADLLIAVPFCAEHLDCVRDFACGEESYERELADRIREESLTTLSRGATSGSTLHRRKRSWATAPSP
jgi:hypothetical protein